MRFQSIITNNLPCLLDMPQSAGSDPLSQTVQGRKRAAVIVSPLHKLRAIVDGDGAVILDIERDLLSSLNPTGAYVWQGLERGETLERIIANLAREAVYGLFILQQIACHLVASRSTAKHLLSELQPTIYTKYRTLPAAFTLAVKEKPK